MKAAIEVAEKHQTPFGAALAMGDELFVTAANQTRKLHDPTAHAEDYGDSKAWVNISKKLTFPALRSTLPANPARCA